MSKRKFVELQHDGFGRRTLLRRVASDNHTRCSWCGSRYIKGAHVPTEIPNFVLVSQLFQYTWVRDDQLGPITELQWDSKHAFCSIDCWRAYTWQ